MTIVRLSQKMPLRSCKLCQSRMRVQKTLQITAWPFHVSGPFHFTAKSKKDAVIAKLSSPEAYHYSLFTSNDCNLKLNSLGLWGYLLNHLILPLEKVTLNLKLFLDIFKSRPLAGPDFKILGAFLYNFN